MKKILSLFIVAITLISCCVGVRAAFSETAEPLWDNISDINNDITFYGSAGKAKATLKGLSGTTEMSGTLKVYKQTARGWAFVASDSDTVTGTLLSLTVDFTGVSGGYYKAVFTVTVTRNGVEEPETTTAYATC